MAFTPEDGNGLPGANGLCDTAVASSFHTDRGNTDWTALGAGVPEQHLIRATDEMNAWAWKGTKKVAGQGTAFPREGITDDTGAEVTGVPVIVQYACAMLARISSLNEIQPQDKGSSGEGQAIKTISKEVGPLKKSTTYHDIQEPDADRFEDVKDMVAWLLVPEDGAGSGPEISSVAICPDNATFSPGKFDIE